MVIGMEIFS